MTNVVGFVFARGGSKGVPRKNVRPIGGVPLIGRAIQAALATRFIKTVYVSTDCEEIAEVAREHGGQVPFMRPAELASDTAPERLAWRHAVEQVEAIEGCPVDVFVSVPAVCPLRSPMDIESAVETLVSGEADVVLTATEASANPYFNMITIDDDRRAEIVIRPDGGVVRRQDAPRVYELVAATYAVRRDSIFEYESVLDGRVEAVVIPPERAVDIDTELDFAFAEFLAERMGQ